MTLTSKIALGLGILAGFMALILYQSPAKTPVQAPDSSGQTTANSEENANEEISSADIDGYLSATEIDDSLLNEESDVSIVTSDENLLINLDKQYE